MENVNEALKVLAKSLVVPCDIITVHRENARRSRTKPFESLRYGSFLLTVASLDAFLTSASGFDRENPGRALGIRPDRVRQAFEKHAGYPNITRHWRARARVSSELLGATYKRAPWFLFEGAELRNYMEDLNDARNILAHGGDRSGFRNRSGALHPLKSGGASLRLMTVEGSIQAVEDIASQTAIALLGNDASIPVWPSPIPTQHASTGRIPTPY